MGENPAIEQPIYIETFSQHRPHLYAATLGDAIHRFPVRLTEIWNQFGQIPAAPPPTLINNGDVWPPVPNDILRLMRSRPLQRVAGTAHKFEGNGFAIQFVVTATHGDAAPVPAGSLAPVLQNQPATGYAPILVDAAGTLVPHDPNTWTIDGSNQYIEFPYGVPPGLVEPLSVTYVEYTGTFGGSGAGGSHVWRRIPDATGTSISLDPAFPTAPTDDVVFPAVSTEGAGSRFFIDVSMGAVRAGVTTGLQWDVGSRAPYTAAFGRDSTASAAGAVVGGGDANTASAILSTVGGGDTNVASAQWAVVGGGQGNTASGTSSSIGGGQGNTASASAGIGGGVGNTASGTSSFIGGGSGNTAANNSVVVVGGANNTASNPYSSIGGGVNNQALAGEATVGGGANNTAGPGGASTVAGGQRNTAAGQLSFVGGGGHTNAFAGNSASGVFSAIVGGGMQNVGGGTGHVASGDFSFIGGGGSPVVGGHHTAGGLAAAIVGGRNNDAAGNFGFVGGGEDNSAGGRWAVAPGGSGNSAAGDYSWAGGLNSAAGHDDAFVWSDSTAPRASNNTDQVHFGAANGFFIYGPEIITGLISGTPGVRMAGQLVSPLPAPGVGDGTFWVNGSGAPSLPYFTDGAGTSYQLASAMIATHPLELVPDPTTATPVVRYNLTTFPGAAVTDDFVFPAASTEGGTSRILFDTSLGAFRAGAPSGAHWDVGNRGFRSAAFGADNVASGAFSAIGGGNANTASADSTVVAGGDGNTATAQWGSVGGGRSNAAAAVYARAGGGFDNSAGGVYSFVGGGDQNATLGARSVVCGGTLHAIDAMAERSFIGGGNFNRISAASSDAVICGGSTGRINPGAFSFIGGGSGNLISSARSGIVAGSNGIASGIASFIGSGVGNPFGSTASGDYSAVCGGGSVAGGGNTASGDFSFVGGGGGPLAADGNTASGDSSVVPGGRTNTASGNFSWAGGLGSTAGHANAFVWSDSTAPRASTAADQVHFGAAGGFFIYGPATVNGKLTVTGLIDPTGVLISGQALPGPTPAPGAGNGTFWVRTGPPSLPYFTDDTGSSYQLISSGAVVHPFERFVDASGTSLRYNVTAFPGAVVTDDFVFPAQSTEGPTARFLFDTSLGAFRAGRTTGAQWDVASRGAGSIAFGTDTTASGADSFAAGSGSTASSANTFVWSDSTPRSSTGVDQVHFGAAGGFFVYGPQTVSGGATINGGLSVTGGITVTGGGTVFGKLTVTGPIDPTALAFTEVASNPFPPGAALTGTVSAGAGSPNILGAGTLFTSELVPGSSWVAIAGEEHQVLTITDDLNLILATNHVLGSGGFVPFSRAGLGTLWVNHNGGGAGSQNYLVYTDDFGADHVLSGSGATPGIWIHAASAGGSLSGNLARVDRLDPSHPGEPVDLVFGSTDTEDTGLAGDDIRLLFDKSRGALRAGRVTGTLWDHSGANLNRGLYSVAFGDDTIASGGFSAVGGGEFNGASGVGSSVGGGSGNRAQGSHSSVGGGGSPAAAAVGDGNRADGDYSVVCGGGGPAGAARNSATAPWACVVGGTQNAATANYTFIGGGASNSASIGGACIGGGSSNIASGSNAFVGAGNGNTASGFNAFVGGGNGNTAGAGTSSVVCGGSANLASADFGTVAGGNLNTSAGTYTFIGGGRLNSIGANSYSTIAGGFTNAVTNTYCFIGGGDRNTANNGRSTIGGGQQNVSSAGFSFIGGGFQNTLGGLYAAIAGGRINTVTVASSYAVIGGGENNTASQTHAVVAGGMDNTAAAVYSVVGGGRYNQANGNFSAVLGGNSNSALGVCSFVGGGGNSTKVAVGQGNAANAQYSTVCGGGTSDAAAVVANSATADYSTVCGGGGALAADVNSAGALAAFVGGGEGNTASGQWAVVPGGRDNTASGDYSWAGGQGSSSAGFANAFVWSGSTPRAATAADQVHFGAANGFYVYGLVRGDSGLHLVGQAGSPAPAPGANNGAFWVLQGATSLPYFTDSTGASYALAPAASAIHPFARFVDVSGTSLRYDPAFPGYAVTDDFVFPTTSTEWSAGNADRVFFDTSLWAFRAGRTTGTQWNLASRGAGSAAFGTDNTAAGADAFAAGSGNTAAGANAFAAGTGNTAVGANAFAAGTGNAVSGANGAAAFGINNTNMGSSGFCAGNGNTCDNWGVCLGRNNTHTAPVIYAAILGGEGNTVAASSQYSTIGGGQSNIAGGGAVADTHCTVAGGVINQATGQYSTVGGGRQNIASGAQSIIAGGETNTASGIHAFVGGGFTDVATGDYSVVAGGQSNSASNSHASVGGGQSNSASNSHASVGGGLSNASSGTYTVVAGGQDNGASGDWGAIGGGQDNLARDVHTFAGGGQFNVAGDGAAGGTHSFVGGGHGNSATGLHSVVVGGGTLATAVAGDGNRATGDYSVVCGGGGAVLGARNVASGLAASVGGGESNIASGARAVVPGGGGNSAAGDYSWAGGQGSTAVDAGSFVWSDGTGLRSSSASNQVTFGARGGFRILDGRLEVRRPGAFGGGLLVEEAAVAPGAALVAGEGMFWVRSDAPNTPMYTDDTPTDWVIPKAPVASGVLGPLVAFNGVLRNYIDSSAYIYAVWGTRGAPTAIGTLAMPFPIVVVSITVVHHHANAISGLAGADGFSFEFGHIPAGSAHVTASFVVLGGGPVITWTSAVNGTHPQGIATGLSIAVAAGQQIGFRSLLTDTGTVAAPLGSEMTVAIWGYLA